PQRPPISHPAQYPTLTHIHLSPAQPTPPCPVLKGPLTQWSVTCHPAACYNTPSPPLPLHTHKPVWDGHGVTCYPQALCQRAGSSVYGHFESVSSFMLQICCHHSSAEKVQDHLLK